MKRFIVWAALVGLVLTSALLLSAITKLSGSVAIDGSSTVYPITEAVAEEFGKVQPAVKVTVGISGTGGGFKKFCAGETDISDASRPIKKEEAGAAAKNKVSYIELPVAYDGISVVVNAKNTWCDKLTVAELKKIWEPGSKIKTWADVRKGFPNKALKLYGPGTDSGTFDYFTEAINGKAKASRADYTASEDDNVLVQGVAGDQYALGYFGFAYYEENKSKLKVIPIDNGKGAIGPSQKTIANGTYAPLSRPLFIYVSSRATKRAEVDGFVQFYLKNASKLAKEVGYIPLPPEANKLVSAHYAKRKTGSVFAGKDTIGVTIQELLAKEK